MPITRNWQPTLTIGDFLRRDRADHARVAEEKGKAFFMLYSNAELSAKATELFRRTPFCDHCSKRVLAPDHAIALHRNRDGKWLLLHNPLCSVHAIGEENQRLQDARENAKALAGAAI